MCTTVHARAGGMATALSSLSSAPSKEAVLSLIDACFRHRSDLSMLPSEARALEFGLAPPAFDALAAALVGLIRAILASSASISSQEEIFSLLPPDLDVRLKKLLCQIFLSRLPLWREASVRQRVSLPSLVDLDWRVDVKSSSEAVSRISVPTLLLNLKTRKLPTSTLEFPGEDTLSIELSRG